MLDKTINSVTYQGGEGRNVFPIPFPFLESGHIRAWIRDASGKKTALQPGTDYAVNRIAEGNGELVLQEQPLPGTSRLVISRLVPLTQEILFHNQGPNSPRAIEEAVDKLTMIAQQLQDGINDRVPFQEGSEEEAIGKTLANTVDMVRRMRGELTDAVRTIDAKAPLTHRHGISEIGALEKTLENMATADDLAAKADRSHAHVTDDVAGLATELGKLQNHASRHAASGADPIRPEDIGALSAPPADGKPYLAVAGGWIEYIAPANGETTGGGGGTLDHSRLTNRNAADQHPQSAIQHLPKDLASLRVLIETANAALALKAEKTELPSPASVSENGLMSAADKKKLDALPASVRGLPTAGTAGCLLGIATDGNPAWTETAAVADALPLMTVSRKGVARLAANAGLELNEEGALRLAGDNRVSKANIDARLKGLDDRVGELPGVTTRVAAAETAIAAINGKVNGMGAMANAGDAPRNGKPHLRKDGGWVEFSGQGSAPAAIIGEIRLLPFRKNELPAGWYFCNGDRYPLASAQGKALAALSQTMKNDWGVKVADNAISLPNLFSGENGHFLRPVNNSSRHPGNRQGDAIRNLSGTMSIGPATGLIWVGTNSGSSTATGIFKIGNASKAYGHSAYGHGRNMIADLEIDASQAVPTAAENRPLNIGMTPAIYLGV